MSAPMAPSVIRDHIAPSPARLTGCRRKGRTHSGGRSSSDPGARSAYSCPYTVWIGVDSVAVVQLLTQLPVADGDHARITLVVPAQLPDILARERPSLITDERLELCKRPRRKRGAARLSEIREFQVRSDRGRIRASRSRPGGRGEASRRVRSSARSNPTRRTCEESGKRSARRGHRLKLRF